MGSRIYCVMYLLYCLLSLLWISNNGLRLKSAKKRNIFRTSIDRNVFANTDIDSSSKVLSSNHTSKYKYTSCIMTRVRDVDYLLEEWFAYHMAIGVDRFIIADDCSSDKGKTLAILEKYERMGVVTLYRKNPHLDCDNFRPNSSLHMSYMFHREKDNCHWITSIDPDEYIFPVADTVKINFLNDILSGTSSPLIRMVVFLMSNRGDLTRTTEPLIHRYQHGRSQLFLKSFAQSRAVYDWQSAHTPNINVVWNGTPVVANLSYATINGSDIIKDSNFCQTPTASLFVRHYRSISWEDFQMRKKRKFEATGEKNRYVKDTKAIWLSEKNKSTCVLPGSVEFLPKILETLYTDPTDKNSVRIVSS